jgi:hypothetical protein
METGTLRERQAEELKALGKDLSAADKKAIYTEMGKTKAFLGIYLRGEGTSTDYGYDIIKKARAIVSARYNQLKPTQKTA